MDDMELKKLLVLIPFIAGQWSLQAVTNPQPPLSSGS